MNGQETLSNNSLLEGTFLGSKYFDPLYLFNHGYAFTQEVFSFGISASGEFFKFYYFVTFLLAIFFLFIISYCVVRMFEIRTKEHQHLAHEIKEYARHQKQKEALKEKQISHNPRWVQTLNYLLSENPGDWRLSIIEADSMLDSLMDQLGFKGESLGDKLKSAKQDNFKYLATAWEVHNLRNNIAHEGSNYQLSQYEAKRAIAQYENIFRNYGYI